MAHLWTDNADKGAVIVLEAADGLTLITQPDHAALAGHIMRGWCADEMTTRPTRDVILLATREHDNGWREVDLAPEINSETGRPYDFQDAPAHLKQTIWPLGIDRLAAASASAAALVAQHALTIHGRHRAAPDWRPFFDTITLRRDALIRASGIDRWRDRSAFVRDYNLVYLGDVLSLIFCNVWSGPVEAAGYVIERANETLYVAPDPFEAQTLALQVQARRIPNRRYASHEELRAMLEAADTFWIKGLATGRRVGHKESMMQSDGRMVEQAAVPSRTACVLFACVENAGRSQMAAAWFNALSDPVLAQALSAGTAPGKRVHPEVIEAMKDAGIDLTAAVPRRLADALASEVDLLVTMGCGEMCPVVPGLTREDWPLPDPKGQPLAVVRQIRDEIRTRVERLITERGWAHRAVSSARPEPVP